MSDRIALIDYGAGNLTSVRKAFAALGADLFTPASPADLGEAAAIVVPGVGHFGATRALGPDWTEAILARVGDLQTELVHDFFEGFAIGARANVHVKVLYGRSSHHHVEAVFKAFARALRVACSKDKRLTKVLPSTKGLL